MTMGVRIFRLVLPLLFAWGYPVCAQISPGDLSKAHAHLEGMSNCTQCHVLGEKVSNSKCLACHTEIKTRIEQQKGYHASSEVNGKECASCHSDHHGRNFQIVRFDPATFKHDLTGYKLEGAHAKQKCNDCHSSKFISDPKLKAKPSTYLGLSNSCIACHADYHQNTLSHNCLDCHGNASFKPAVKFNHNNAKFPLVGQHQTVDCVKCHAVETKAGKSFQHFAGVKFSNCTSCHTDVHQNKFGQNCKQCHSETSFHNIKSTSNFDHSKTGFPLEGKHLGVSCVMCHKNNVTDPVKHDRCTDCHADYHSGQFAQAGKSPDCAKCHSVNGFSPSNYPIEQHQSGNFALKGAHAAVACIECHKKQENWNFRNIGIRCTDCHADPHQTKMSAKYYPDKDCRNCHSESGWAQVRFDHSKTNFPLTGVHATTNCRACHYPTDDQGRGQQRFSGLSASCTSCHRDNHNGQFNRNGIADCNECHTTINWRPSKFDHGKTAFKLDGQHEHVACAECHKPIAGERVIQYKIKDFRCESCHY